MSGENAEIELQETAHFLRNVGLFRSLDDSERMDLSSILERKPYSSGELIFRYGDVGRHLFVIESGTVELSVRDTTGDKIVLSEIGPSEVFGELSVLDGAPRSAAASALTDCYLLTLSREHLSEFLTRHPQAGLDLLAVLAKRIREADHLLMSRVTRNINLEVAQEFKFFQRISSWIADFSGSIQFLMLNAAFFITWIVINVGGVPFIAPFDPYPFGFLTMAVSLEAIFLSIFVLLAQNLQSTKDKIRGDIEYEVNLKAELEVAELHTKVDHLHTTLVLALREIGR